MCYLPLKQCLILQSDKQSERRLALITLKALRSKSCYRSHTESYSLYPLSCLIPNPLFPLRHLENNIKGVALQMIIPLSPMWPLTQLWFCFSLPFFSDFWLWIHFYTRYSCWLCFSRSWFFDTKLSAYTQTRHLQRKSCRQIASLHFQIAFSLCLRDFRAHFAIFFPRNMIENKH